MVFFRRLRLRWRERHYERKLRDGTGAARGISSSLRFHRITLRPLLRDRSAEPEHKTVHSSTLLDASRLQSQAQHDAVVNHAVSTLPTLDNAIVTFVTHENQQQRQTFVDELALLRGLQLLVPATRVHIDAWAMRHHTSVHLPIKTERDLVRWRQSQSILHDELVRICGMVASAARLRLVDRQREHTDEPAHAGHRQLACPHATVTASTAVPVMPHPEICVAMVIAALCAGIYGLFAVALVLKLLQTI